jgi:branched-subunit amino acid permease
VSPRSPQVVKFVIALYLGMTPFAIVDTLGWLTPVGIFILSLLFLAVDEIGAEIEDPFGTCKYSSKASGAGAVVDRGYPACVLACLRACSALCTRDDWP